MKLLAKMLHRLRNPGRAGYESRKPDFMIIGAQKCGTSSLHHYLSQHPRVIGSQPKELHFFDSAERMERNGFEWYESHFSGPRSGLYFESTPTYLYHPGVPERLHAYAPDLKMVVLLRDPVRRSYSAYNHYRTHYAKALADPGHPKSAPRLKRITKYFVEDGGEFPTFRKAVECELEAIRSGMAEVEPALLRRSLYIEQLERFWKVFGRNRLLIIGFRDLVEHPHACLERILHFVGGEVLEHSGLDLTPKNVKGYSAPLSTEDESFLRDYFDPYDRRLFAEIGPLNW